MFVKCYRGSGLSLTSLYWSNSIQTFNIFLTSRFAAGTNLWSCLQTRTTRPLPDDRHLRRAVIRQFRGDTIGLLLLLELGLRWLGSYFFAMKEKWPATELVDPRNVRLSLLREMRSCYNFTHSSTTLCFTSPMLLRCKQDQEDAVKTSVYHYDWRTRLISLVVLEL